jgi:ferric-dicitrate binding protein FerR (iron transport regulator)
MQGHTSPSVQRKRNKLPALAGVLLLLLSPVAFLFYTHFKLNAVVFKEIETKAGERISFNLSDGTKITLGPDSKLKFPTSFNDTLRYVYLTGEAFFEVSKSPHSPFIVHSDTWDTRVMGTKFNVSAFPDDSKMTVALVEGKVDVKSGHETYHIIPGQQLLLNKPDNRIYLQNFDKEEVTGWVRNNLVFRNVPFYEAATKLERIYNVKMIFQNKNIANQMLWATFDNEPITQILQTIKIATGIKYKIEGRIIYIIE